jgi:hypothetical protein
MIFSGVIPMTPVFLGSKKKQPGETELTGLFYEVIFGGFARSKARE